MLCTVEDVEVYLKTNFSDSPSGETLDLNQVEYLIEAISDRIEQITNKTFLTTTYTELYDGHGTQDLVLRQRPTSGVTAATYVDTKGDVSSTIDLDYVTVNLNQGTIYRSVGWAQGRNNISITYIAGYATVEDIPRDLNLICVEQVSQEISFANVKDKSKESEKLGEHSWKLSANFYSAKNISELTEKLSEYMNYSGVG